MYNTNGGRPKALDSKTTRERIWASCENCGQAWTEEKNLPKVWKPIPCPACGKKTENFDTENHNVGMHFKHY